MGLLSQESHDFYRPARVENIMHDEAECVFYLQSSAEQPHLLYQLSTSMTMNVRKLYVPEHFDQDNMMSILMERMVQYAKEHGYTINPMEVPEAIDFFEQNPELKPMLNTSQR